MTTDAFNQVSPEYGKIPTAVGTVKVKVARDAKTGRFITQAAAKRRPTTTIVQTVKKPRKPRLVEVVIRSEQ